MKRVAVEKNGATTWQHAVHALEPGRLRHLDSLWVGAVLTPDGVMVQAPQLVAALDDLEATILLCALVHSHKT